MCGKMGTRTGWRMGIMRLPGWSFYFPAGNQCWYIGIGRHEQAYLVDPAFLLRAASRALELWLDNKNTTSCENEFCCGRLGRVGRFGRFGRLARVDRFGPFGTCGWFGRFGN